MALDSRHPHSATTTILLLACLLACSCHQSHAADNGWGVLGSTPNSPVEQLSVHDIYRRTQAAGGVSLVYFYTAWSPESKALWPVYEQAAWNLRKVVLVGAVDMTQLADGIGIKAFPSIKLLYTTPDRQTHTAGTLEGGSFDDAALSTFVQDALNQVPSGVLNPGGSNADSQQLIQPGASSNPDGSAVQAGMRDVSSNWDSSTVQTGHNHPLLQLPNGPGGVQTGFNQPFSGMESGPGQQLITQPGQMMASQGMLLPLPQGGSGLCNEMYARAYAQGQILNPPPVQAPTNHVPFLNLDPKATRYTISAQRARKERREKASKERHAHAHANRDPLPSSYPQDLDTPAMGKRRRMKQEDFRIWFRGGDVMNTGLNVYMIYVGYQETEPTPLWLNYLVVNLQGSRWWRTMTRYQDKTGNPLSDQIRLAGTLYIDSMTFIQMTADSEVGVVGSIAQQVVKRGWLPLDLERGLYVVVGSPKGGLVRSKKMTACGWHSLLGSGAVSSQLKYAFVPDATGNSECTSWVNVPSAWGEIKNGPDTSPSGDVVLDSMTGTLVHELAEALTNPDVETGWYAEEAAGGENGDLCAWEPYNTLSYTLGSRTVAYNQLVGGWPYQLQTIWDIQRQPQPQGTCSPKVCCVQGV